MPTPSELWRAALAEIDQSKAKVADAIYKLLGRDRSSGSLYDLTRGQVFYWRPSRTIYPFLDVGVVSFASDGEFGSADFQARVQIDVFGSETTDLRQLGSINDELFYTLHGQFAFLPEYRISRITCLGQGRVIGRGRIMSEWGMRGWMNPEAARQADHWVLWRMGVNPEDASSIRIRFRAEAWKYGDGRRLYCIVFASEEGEEVVYSVDAEVFCWRYPSMSKGELLEQFYEDWRSSR